MKNLKIKFVFFLVSTILFASCVEDENNNLSDPLDLIGTSFIDSQGKTIPIINNLRGRQQLLSQKVLLKGDFSDVEKRAIKIATSISEYENIEKIIRKNSPEDQQPVVDFENENVIAIFSGIRSTSGYFLTLSNVWEEDGKLILGIKENVIKDGDVVGTVLTTPFLIVTVPKSSLEIEVLFE